MSKILLADDHAMFCEGLCQLLDGEDFLTVVGTASTSAEALATARETDPDLVILDLSMPGRGGLETLADLKRWKPKVQVLILTAHKEDDYAIRCLRAGADGYLTKDKAGEELVTAVTRIVSGGKYIGPSLAEALAMSLTWKTDGPPHHQLSDREFQVMRMIAEGRTVSEIADDLCLSVKTVSTYRSRVLEKMNLKNNAELMRYALREELVE